jgi:hypothetical protein
MPKIQDYLNEARRLTQEQAQPEVLTFAATVNQLGALSYQSPSLRVTPGYMFAVDQIRGGCPIPPQMTNDASAARLWTIAEFLPYIGFNVINEGRQKPVFKLPLAMNLFVDSSGSTQGLRFKVPVTFFEGADISVGWFTDQIGIQQTYPLGPGLTVPRVFNPGQVQPVPRVEFYVYLIGTLIRAEVIA